MRWLCCALALALAGCARGGSVEDVDAAVQRADSSQLFFDAAVTVDAPCTVMTKNLVTNGNFDGTPAGTGWTAAPIDPTYPIVTSDASVVGAQTPTHRAWMGGFDNPPASNKDSLYQDVMIPASTTQLVFKGYYEVRSDEADGSVYDRATIELVSTTGTQLQLIKALDDNGKTTTYTALDVPITATVAGTTVRLRLSTSSDALDITSFYFDTFELNATYCQ